MSFEASGDAAHRLLVARPGRAAEGPGSCFAAAPPKVRMRAQLRPRIRVNMSGVNWFELDAEFVTDDQSVDLGAVRMFLDSGRRFIPLKDGSFAEADLDELKQVAEPARGGRRAARQADARGCRCSTPPRSTCSATLGDVEIDAKARRAMAELQEIDGIPAVKAPEGLEADAAPLPGGAACPGCGSSSATALSGVLADDMGLGKTVQALALLLKVKNEHGAAAGAGGGADQRAAELGARDRALRPGPQVRHLARRRPPRERRACCKDVDLVLTSYALVRRDIDELKQVKFRTVILDEAQNIKNADSATAQACKALRGATTASRSPARRWRTGSPSCGASSTS